MCKWGHGRCTAPDTQCPHWIGTFCELDITWERCENENNKKPPKEAKPNKRMDEQRKAVKRDE